MSRPVSEMLECRLEDGSVINVAEAILDLAKNIAALNDNLAKLVCYTNAVQIKLGDLEPIKNNLRGIKNSMNNLTPAVAGINNKLDPK